MLMLSAVIIAACVDRKEEKGGSSKGTKKGAVDSEHGASKDGICFFVQRATIPSKRLLFYLCIYKRHPCNYMLARLYD